MAENIFALVVGLAMTWSVFLFLQSSDVGSSLHTEGNDDEEAEEAEAGVVWSGIGLFLFVVYYADRSHQTRSIRKILSPIKSIGEPDIQFKSSIALACVVALLYIPRMLVYTEVAKRKPLQKLNSFVAAYLATVTAATCLWFMIHHLYGFGPVRDILLGVCFASIIALGLIGAFEAMAVLALEVCKTIGLHLRRLIVPVWKRLVKVLVNIAKRREKLALRLRRATEARKSSNVKLRTRLHEMETAAETELGRVFRRSKDTD